VGQAWKNVQLASMSTPLSIYVEDDDTMGDVEKSYSLEGGYFVKNNIAVNGTGVAMKDNPKAFTVVPEALELANVIGKGASSYVQRAIHRPSGTQLALKVISIFDKSKRDQLIKEIQTLYDADCDCLIAFYGAYHKEGAITIALEYMDGGSLANVINQVGSIPESVLANVVFQILWGMAYLKHERKVHRDMKPSNILINSLGQVKLSDFGVSAELRNSIGMLATFTGTFKYMSPERILHQPYSFPSDVWSLGLVALECATGIYPYREADTYIEMCETIVESPEPRPSGEFSEEFFQFIASCVRKKAEDRLPPDILLGSPWLSKHGAKDLASAVANVKAWIDSCATPEGEDYSC